MQPDRAPMFRRAALLRSGGIVVGVIAVGLTAFEVTLHVTAIDAGRLKAIPLPATTAALATPSPLADVGRVALSRVVTVEADRLNEEALGTGWLFDTRGDFVTNAHVVQGALTVRITDRRAHTHLAVVIASDPTVDIAVLRSVDGFAGRPLPLDRTAIIATPLPVVDLASSRATGHDDISIAVVTESGRDVPLEPGEVQPGSAAPSVYHDMLALSGAPVFQGNSGGPVLDDQGEVIGILTLASPNRPQSYAIPLTRVLDELTQFAARNG
ncbi:MAG: trypsin-like peptidase domain-containing protein [Chloroflexi bacterium]|nr:MAG: trypsin-like peptidase domain-containing protein [Chloroflexota bacterium]